MSSMRYWRDETGAIWTTTTAAGNVLAERDGKWEEVTVSPIGEARVWVCAVCGHSPEAHGMPDHPAFECVYQPTLTPSDTFASTKLSDRDAAGTTRGWNGGAVDRLTIPRPHVPYGPEHVTPEQADAEYLRSAVRNIHHAQERNWSLWGSNLTATICKLLLDVAEALGNAPTPPVAATGEGNDRG